MSGMSRCGFGAPVTLATEALYIPPTTDVYAIVVLSADHDGRGTIDVPTSPSLCSSEPSTPTTHISFTKVTGACRQYATSRWFGETTGSLFGPAAAVIGTGVSNGPSWV